jgi:hypothetical protein
MAPCNLKVTGVTKKIAIRQFKVHCMANNNPPRKKGPHSMATAYKPESQEELQDQELNAFAKKVHSAIEKSRSNPSKSLAITKS